ncbi:MAG: radical SAM protein [Nitrospirae bacterium]|nr:MAG: radical SAM protein [Nitrospirota bacterium]
MKILFIIPPSSGHRRIVRNIDCSHESKADYLWQPNDFLILSSFAVPGDETALIDGTADRLSDSEFRQQYSVEKPDIIFYAFSFVCWETDLAYFSQIRAIFSETPIFVIGDIFLEQDYRELILKSCEGIVFVPYLIDLKKMAGAKGARGKLDLQGVCTAAETVPFKKPKHVMRIKRNTPRHELFQKKGYIFPFAKRFRFATVTTMWGCPFLCAYCSDSNISPVVSSREDVLIELEHLREMGVTELFFADKAFGFPKENIRPLLKEMAERFRFSWTCYFHPQLYDPELLEAMRDAGCHTIIIGIDSANIPSLALYNRHVNKDKVEALVAHADRLNISVCADLILGLEHETLSDVEKTIGYALSLPLDFASFNIASPLPGSVIRKKVLKEGRLSFGEGGFDTSGKTGIIGSSRIDSETLRKLRTKAILKFYLRPSYLMRRLRKTGSLEHLQIQLLQMIALLKGALGQTEKK